MDHGRRNLLLGQRCSRPLRPPWTTEDAILSACTGCGDCVTACPAAIVATGAGGYPEIRLAEGECTFCGRCAESCSAGVFDLARPAFRHAIAIGGNCLSKTGTECRSCQDACPQAAIRFRPRLGGIAVPELDGDLCTGCGACLAPCPVDAIRAVMPEREAAHA